MATQSNGKMNPELLCSRIRAQKVLFYDGITPYKRITECTYQQISVEAGQAVITAQLTEEEILATSSNTILETEKRLQLLPSLQLHLEEYVEKQKHLLNLQNGVYDVLKGCPCGNTSGLIFDYRLDFKYIKSRTLENAPNFKHYCETSVGKKIYHAFCGFSGTSSQA